MRKCLAPGLPCCVVVQKLLNQSPDSVEEAAEVSVFAYTLIQLGQNSLVLNARLLQK